MDRSRLTSVLALPDFRRVWFAEIISDAGSFVTFIALAVYVHDLTGDAFSVGLALALRAVPWIVVGPVGGVIADRMDRRTIMIACDVARAGLVAVLPFTTEVWQAYLLSFTSAVFSPLFRPARQALLPTIAPGGHYVRAVALSEVAHQVLHTVGPALGGVAVLAVGARNAFFLDAVSFLISATFLVGVRARVESRRPSTFGEVGRELRDGIRTLRADRVVSSLVLSRAIVLFGIGEGLVALLLVYLSGHGHGAGSYGTALAVAGLGTAAGTALLARRRPSAPRVVPLLVSAASPVLLTLVLLDPGYPQLLAVIGAIGLGAAGMALYVSAAIAERIPDAARGRVFSLTGAVYESAELAGALILAALGGAIGAARGMAVGAVVASVAATALLGGRMRLFRAADAERAVLSSVSAPVPHRE